MVDEGGLQATGWMIVKLFHFAFETDEPQSQYTAALSKKQIS